MTAHYVQLECMKLMLYQRCADLRSPSQVDAYEGDSDHIALAVCGTEMHNWVSAFMGCNRVGTQPNTATIIGQRHDMMHRTIWCAGPCGTILR